MAEQIKEHDEATDADIRAIIEEGEAGIGDVIAAYEEAERYYIGAAVASQPAEPTVRYTTDTRL